MGRWTQYDEDSYRLPEGMKRIGYDADTQQYTFSDSDGSTWESAPGSEYGRLRPAGSDWRVTPAEAQAMKENNRASWAMLTPFLLLVGLVLLLFFRLLSGAGSATPNEPSKAILDCGDAGQAIPIRTADTCWKIATEHDMSVDELRDLNEGIDCDRLVVGQELCVKKA